MPTSFLPARIEAAITRLAITSQSGWLTCALNTNSPCRQNRGAALQTQARPARKAEELEKLVVEPFRTVEKRSARIAHGSEPFVVGVRQCRWCEFGCECEKALHGNDSASRVEGEQHCALR